MDAWEEDNLLIEVETVFYATLSGGQDAPVSSNTKLTRELSSLDCSSSIEKHYVLRVDRLGNSVISKMEVLIPSELFFLMIRFIVV